MYRMNRLHRNWQIPPDLVVKSQATDIIDIVLQLIRRANGVHRAWRNRKSRSELRSTPEVQWSTTKSDGVWDLVVMPGASHKTLDLSTCSLHDVSSAPTAISTEDEMWNRALNRPAK